MVLVTLEFVYASRYDMVYMRLVRRKSFASIPSITSSAKRGSPLLTPTIISRSKKADAKVGDFIVEPCLRHKARNRRCIVLPFFFVFSLSSSIPFCPPPASCLLPWDAGPRRAWIPMSRGVSIDLTHQATHLTLRTCCGCERGYAVSYSEYNISLLRCGRRESLTTTEGNTFKEYWYVLIFSMYAVFQVPS